MRVGSRQERSLLLDALTERLMAHGCVDLVALAAVDALCCRTWDAMHPGWLRWSFYVRGLLPGRDYHAWGAANGRLYAPKAKGG